MRRYLWLLSFAALALPACGSSGALSRSELIKQADAICMKARLKQDQFPPAQSPAEVALTDAYVNPLFRTADKELRALKPPASEKATWDRYISARDQAARQTDQEQQIAARGDLKALNAITAEENKAAAQRTPLARQLGLQVCGRQADIIGKPQSVPGPPSNVAFPKPVEPLAAAVNRLSQAKSCDQLRALQHSDDRRLPAAACQQLLPALKGFKLIGTHDLGSVAVADIASAMGRESTVQFVLDKDRKLHFANLLPNEGGAVHPALAGNDAKANAEQLMQAIRRNDVAAFNALLSPESGFTQKGGVTLSNPTGSGPAMVADIRKDAAAKPLLLGTDQAFAAFVVKANGHYYTLIELHTAAGAAKTTYKLSAFYPLPTSA